MNCCNFVKQPIPAYLSSRTHPTVDIGPIDAKIISVSLK